MSRIIEDTLKRNGNWSKQSLTFFVSFIISIVFGVTNTIVSYVSGIVNNPTADNIFNSFMFLTAALSGANIVNKYVDVVKARSEKTGEIENNYNNTYQDEISKTRY
jgi:hypothetical protein